MPEYVDAAKEPAPGRTRPVLFHGKKDRPQVSFIAEGRDFYQAVQSVIGEQMAHKAPAYIEPDLFPGIFWDRKNSDEIPLRGAHRRPLFPG